MPYKPPKIEKIQYHISEVAKMFDVNLSLLRYWENEFSILKPHKNAKGTRYFTPKDIDTLHLIFHLVKEQGLTLDGAKKKLKDNREQTHKNFEIIKRLTKVRAQLITLNEEIETDESTKEEIDPFEKYRINR